MQLKDGSNLQFGKYRIIRVLGQGGFGITYLAQNTYLGKMFAIKEFFPKDFCGRDNTSHLTLGTQNNTETVAKLKARFLKEAKNIARLDHPGIIKIHDIFEENNTAYYVMDYIDGENLNEMVTRNGPLSEDRAVNYIRKVGDALDYIHSRNMTHFDVKPANIVVRRSDDMPILIDFGLSKQYDAHGDATSTLMQGVSHGYSPIELYNPGTLSSFSPQTDVYSLAATLYYLLTATVPPPSSEILENGITIPPSISDSNSSAIKAAMSIPRSKRPQHIISFTEQLSAKKRTHSSTQQTSSAINEETVFINPRPKPEEPRKQPKPKPQPTPQPPKKSTSGIWWGIIIAVCLIIIVAIADSGNNTSNVKEVPYESEYFEKGVLRGAYTGEGYWSGNNYIPNGNGTAEYYKNDKDNRKKYIGQFKDGVRTQGNLYYNDGSYYTGSFKNDKLWNGYIHWNNGSGSTTLIQNGVSQ